MIKKLLLALMILPISVFAEMQWVGINPTPQDGDGGSLVSGEGIPASYNPFEVGLTVVDSSANADSSCVTWYSTVINTEDVMSATGLFQVVSITDSSTDTGHLFALGGDSTFVWYTVKTGYMPYDANAQTLVAGVEATTVSGTAIRVPITLTFEGDEGVDSLFKPFTWFEFTVCDSTRWSEVNVAADPVPIVDSNITGTWVPADTMVLAGTYGGIALGMYHIRIFVLIYINPSIGH